MTRGIEHADPSPEAGDDVSTPEKPSSGAEKHAAPHGRRLVPRKVYTQNLTSRTCRWPFGDPAQGDFYYCGKLPVAGRSYCQSHEQLSYQPVRGSRRS